MGSGAGYWNEHLPKLPSVGPLIHQRVSVPMRQPPFIAFAPEDLRHPQPKDRRVGLCGATQAIGLNAHDIREFAARFRSEDFALVSAARKMRRGPIQARSDLIPTALGAAESAEHRDVLSMRIEVLQVRG